MKKELKDYLHFYLGCEFVYNSNPQKRYILDITELSIVQNSWNIKPILRSLSDMTEEESKDFQIIAQLEKEDLSCIEYKPNLFSNELELGTAHLTNVFQWANGVQYLLSKHFDLFNLIESDLAIDAKTLTPTT